MVIKKIVDSVLMMLHSSPYLFEGDQIVGLYPRLRDLTQLLRLQSNEVVIVGICGKEGTGKTTLAKAIYRKIGHHFKRKGFLENVRDISTHNGLDGLQEIFFSSVLYEEEGKTCNNIYGGENVIKEILHRERALIVLDDVSEMDHFRALCGNHECYGQGSRIIITTKDRNLLSILGVDEIFRVVSPYGDDHLKLFSWNAFKQASPSEAFYDLAIKAVQCCAKKPLALELLGSVLAGKQKEEWKSVLEELERIPTHDILDSLKIIYDCLSDEEKDIFLYIYCSFIGKDRYHVTQMLDCCGLIRANVALTGLIEKSFVSVDNNNKLKMHYELKELGRTILREKTKPSWIYNVFLSFRGEDTRQSFTSHLYTALTNAGLEVFMDNRLERGGYIPSSLSQAISGSRIAIVIFSENYGGSRWCLEELEKIMECHRTMGHMVFPVFYHVDPSKVRKQTGAFGEAFDGLLMKTSATKDKRLHWRRLLTEAANFSGWDLKNYR